RGVGCPGIPGTIPGFCALPLLESGRALPGTDGSPGGLDPVTEPGGGIPICSGGIAGFGGMGGGGTCACAGRSADAAYNSIPIKKRPVITAMERRPGASQQEQDDPFSRSLHALFSGVGNVLGAAALEDLLRRGDFFAVLGVNRDQHVALENLALILLGLV